jgi:competence protein ComEC
MEAKLTAFIADKFLFSSVVYIIGVALALTLPFGFSGAFLLALLSSGLYLCSFIFKNPGNSKSFRLIALTFLLLSVAGLRVAIKNFHVIPQELTEKIGVTEITLRIIEEPKDKDSHITYIGYSDEYKEKVLIRSERNPRFEYGDVISFSGTLERGAPFESEEGKIVPYDKILATKDIYFTLTRATGQLIRSGEGNVLRSALFRVKAVFLGNLKLLLPEPHATLVSGIVFGSDDTLGKENDEAFRTAGITHIIVLSGYNLTIVAVIVLSLLRFLPLYGRTAVASGAVAVFAMMAGGGASVVRASIMALVALLAKALGRKYVAGRMLVATAGVMLLINPSILFFDLGFELSFLATAALIWLSPLVEKRLYWVPKRLGMREIISTSLSAQMAVLPLLVWSIGKLSVYGIISNMFVLPVVPLIMVLGAILAIIGFLSRYILLPLVAILWLLTQYVITVSQFVSSLPFSSVSFSLITLVILVFVYGIFIWWLFPNLVFMLRSYFERLSRGKNHKFLIEI